MKSNENPFRRVHSRSLVDRVARPILLHLSTTTITPSPPPPSFLPSPITVHPLPCYTPPPLGRAVSLERALRFFASILLRVSCVYRYPRRVCTRARANIVWEGGSRSNSFHFLSPPSAVLSRLHATATEYYGTMVKLLVHALHSFVLCCFLSPLPPPTPSNTLLAVNRPAAFPIRAIATVLLFFLSLSLSPFPAHSLFLFSRFLFFHVSQAEIWPESARLLALPDTGNRFRFLLLLSSIFAICAVFFSFFSVFYLFSFFQVSSRRRVESRRLAD